MRNHDFFGIDVSKDKFDACLFQEKDKYQEAVFDNTAAGIKKFVAWVSKKQTKPAWIGMEATGHYSEILAECLIGYGLQVSVINPVKIKHFGKVMLSRNKNDRVDARVIAGYCNAIELEPFKARSEEQKELRELVQLQDSQKEQLTQLKLRLNSTQSLAAKKALKKLIKAAEKQLDWISGEVKVSIEKNPTWSKISEQLMSIKGVGFSSVTQLLAYLPDIKLFKNAKQLAAFIGVSPRQTQSGKYTGETKLSKLGNPKLRKSLYMPALCAKRHNEALRPFVCRLKERGLSPKAIIGAVMRKLVHIIFGMLKHGAFFDPNLVSRGSKIACA